MTKPRISQLRQYYNKWLRHDFLIILKVMAMTILSVIECRLTIIKY